MLDFLFIDFKGLTIGPKASLLEALKVLNAGAEQIAFVVKNDVLIATITDGDIRRGLLQGLGLDDEISPVMNREFRYVKEGENAPKDVLLALKGIKCLPVLDQHKTLKSVIKLSNGLGHNEHFSNSVVIMAGGKGTRLRPFTENCPKPMLEVHGKPMLEQILDKCILSGFTKFYISVNYLKEQIISYFQDGSQWGVSIEYLEENIPLGTAGSLSLLPKDLCEPILVLNGDVITDFDPGILLHFHKENQADATLCVREHHYTLPYGVVKTKGVELSEFQEKPTYKYFANAGVYIIDPSLLRSIQPKTYIDMPTLLENTQKSGSCVSVCPIHEFWIDVGRPESLEEVNQLWTSNE